MEKKKSSFQAYGFIILLSVFLGMGVAVKMNWVGDIQAQSKTQQGPDWIFGGTTPRSFSELATRVQDAVVNISTTKTLKLRRGPFYQFNEDYYRRYFRNQPDLKRPNSLGSGFILDKEGFILTNNHVVQGADEILVKLSDGRIFNAVVVGTDPKTDLAVIRIKTKEDLPTVRLGNSDSLKIGDWVVAIGNPFGLTQTVTAGILSARGRVIGAGPYDNFLQTDASINPGNSGGPLFNLQGEVVGVNTAIIAGGQGIGFAIPINQAKVVIPQLISQGKVQRGYLGIGLKELTPDLAKQYGLKRPRGVIVAQVYENSPAHLAGIQSGDLILKFNGQDLIRSQDLPILVSQSPVGAQAQVEYLRNGKVMVTEVKLGSLENASSRAVVSQPQKGGQVAQVLGLAVRDVSPVEQQRHGLTQGAGVTVIQVNQNSPAASVGLQPGDLILELNNKAVSGSEQFLQESKKLKSGQVVRMYVKRGPLASYFAFSL
ncbi:MAG: Do family serine endopeptidase [bacterium]|nr:Do family serine endopeptidase [bacterium]